MNDYLDRVRDRRQKMMQYFVLIVGLPLSVSGWLFAMNLREFKENIPLWSDPTILKVLLVAVLAPLTLFGIVWGLSRRWQRPGRRTEDR